MHILMSDMPLEELRRQLRDGEITYSQYKTALRVLPEPAPVMCANGCGREAHSIERGRAVCAVCGLVRRNARRPS